MKNRNFKKIYNLLLVFCMLGLFSICFAANNDTEAKSSKDNEVVTKKDVNIRTGRGFGKGSEKNQNAFCIYPQ